MANILGSGQPPEIPDDFLSRIAEANNFGPISTAFAGLLDAQRAMHNIAMKRLADSAEQYEKELARIRELNGAYARGNERGRVGLP